MSGFSAYTGLGGSGKSYNVVQHVMVPAIEKGQEVWTNIPLNEEVWIERYGKAPHFFDIQDIRLDANPAWPIETLPKGALLVLDEAQMVFPSGMKATAIPDPWKEFFTQYRHRVGDDGHTSEFVVLTQDLQNICSFVRNLIGITYRHRKLSQLGSDKLFSVDHFQGPASGPNPPARQRFMQSGPFKYKPKVYELYKSATQSDTGTVGDESRADKRGNIWRSSKVWMTLIFILVLIPAGIYMVYDFFSGFGGASRAEQTIDQVNERTPTASGSGQVTTRSKAPLDNHDMFIVFNNGHFPRVEYRISIESSNTRSVVTLNELRRIGYNVQPITECMLLVKYNNSERVVSCQKPDDERPKNTIFSQTI